MENLKFRAWDKKTKKMRAVNSIAFHYEEESFDFDNSRLPKVVNLWGKDVIEDKPIVLHREVSEVVLMLSTGSRDKNNKDIYDGDYIRCNNINYEVYWSDIWNGWFVRELFTSNNDFLSKILTDDTEVIGNLYENQELIN